MNSGTIFRALAIFFCLTVSDPARADECVDILVNGSMTTSSQTSQSYSDRIKLAETFKSDLKDMSIFASGDVALPVEGLPIPVEIGGSVTGSRTTNTIESVKTFVRDLEWQKSEFLLSSGDEVIVSAWRGCMMKRSGGIFGRFENIDSKNSNLILEFLPISGSRSYSMTISKVEFDVSKLSSPPRLPPCMTVGRKLWVGDPCSATFSMNTYYDELLINVEGSLDIPGIQDGPTYAVNVKLLPRISITPIGQGKASAFAFDGQRFSGTSHLFRMEKRTTTDQTHYFEVRLDDGEAMQGWILAPLKEGRTEFSTNVFVRGHDENVPDSGTAYCHFQPVDRTALNITVKLIWKNTTSIDGECTIKFDVEKIRYGVVAGA